MERTPSSVQGRLLRQADEKESTSTKFAVKNDHDASNYTFRITERMSTALESCRANVVVFKRGGAIHIPASAQVSDESYKILESEHTVR
jgi:hypothetical protein